MNRKNGAIRASGCSSEYSSSETRPSNSGFQSFLKWFRKNESDRLRQNAVNLNCTSQPHMSNGASSSSHPCAEDRRCGGDAYVDGFERNGGIQRCHRPLHNSNDTLLGSPPSPPVLSASSSCDSIYSTATTGFAFIPPNQYRPYGNACQPEKLIAAGPLTDTYRDRIRAHQNAKEIDQRLELTLRKKYNIYATDTITSRTSIANDLYTSATTTTTLTNNNNTNQPKQPDHQPINQYYTDRSLPQQPSTSFQSREQSEAPSSSSSSGRHTQHHHHQRHRRRSHRRTVSDSSKDKKAGAYVHVKGKRKAPPPPSTTVTPSSPSTNNYDSNYGTIRSPASTLGRKKRRAPPPPPLDIQHHTTNNGDSDSFPTVLNDDGGIFDDAEIAAIIGGGAITSTSINHYTTTAITKMHQSKMETPKSPFQPITSPTTSETSSLQSTDTLKLEQGQLRSTRDLTISPPPLHLQRLQEENVSPVTSNSPISPRPWYKRSSSNSNTSNKDHYAIPFKREVTLKTMEKRKVKNAAKELESPHQLPEVSFSRNSSLFDGFFARVTSTTHHNHHNDNKSEADQEKRRSGIGMPNISELDREAAEILSREQANERAKLQAEHDKYFQNFNEPPVSEAAATSTKDLINRFEETTNQIKFTVNTAFIDKADRDKYFTEQQTSTTTPSVVENTTAKNISQTSTTAATTTTAASTSSSSSASSLSQIIFSNLRQNQAAAESTTTTTAEDVVLREKPTQKAEEKTFVSSSSSARAAAVKSKNAKEKENDASTTTTTTLSPATTWVCSYCTLENYNWRVICEVCERIKPYGNDIELNSVIDSKNSPIERLRYIKNASGPTVAPSLVNRSSTDQTKTERMMKYFRPTKSNNTLSKSSSETSVGNPIFKKSTLSINKLTGSPKLTAKQRQTDVIRPQTNEHKSTARSEDSLAAVGQQHKPNLIDSSAVTTTSTAVFVAPLPQRHEEPQNLEELRAVRVAKFSEPPVNKSTMKSPPAADHSSSRSSLEREKQRLRDMISEMNARALADSYPTKQQEGDLLAQSTGSLNAETKLRNPTPPPVVKASTAAQDTTKLGAIKKLFHRKTSIEPPEDKIISDNSNYTETKSTDKEQYQYSKVTNSTAASPPARRPDVLHLLPTPIMEMNENDASPMFGGPKPSASDSVDVIDQQINSIYAQLKKDVATLKDSSEDEIIVKDKGTSEQMSTAKEMVQDFKATLQRHSSTSQFSNTNTLVLNKILKNLEVAICDGQHEQAAKLAMDLAKMKVSLSVTKQQQVEMKVETAPPLPLLNLPSESMNKSVILDMFIEDKDTHKGPIHLQVLPTISILELKQKVEKDFNIPVDIQRWIINNALATDDKKPLSEFNIKNKSIVYLYIVTPPPPPERRQSDTKISNHNQPHQAITTSAADNQELEEEGAKALPLLRLESSSVTAAASADPFGTLKIGWTCPLCTLINSPNRPGCVVCSETRPSDYVVPPEYKMRESAFEMPEELRKFLADDVDESNKLPQLQLRNDLNRKSANRKSTELFNIIVREKSPPTQNDTTTAATEKVVPDTRPKIVAATTKSRDEPMKPICVVTRTETPATKMITTSIVMTAITSSPNITKNKYRGVDNYNPHINTKVTAADSTTAAPSKIPYKSPLVKPIRTTGSRSVVAAAHHQPLNLKPYVAKPIKLPEKRIVPCIFPPVTTTSSAVAKVTTIEEPITKDRNSKHYTELLSLDKSSVVSNVEPFECPVCFMKFSAGEGIVLRECIHTFCRECIVNTVKYSDEAEVKCPYMDAEYSCDSVIQEREIRSLMTKEEYDQHLAISLTLAEHRMENAFHCKTPSCRGWCVFEDNVNQFKCPICKITNCLTCRVIHDGLNCKQYQDRLNSDCDSNVEARRTGDMLAEMINKGEAMKCPICQVILMKKWGCDWLKCSMCKTEICWVTRGIRWGPEGKGDTSAGCKCGVNGVKCHPKCNYCH